MKDIFINFYYFYQILKELEHVQSRINKIQADCAESYNKYCFEEQLKDALDLELKYVNDRRFKKEFVFSK